MKWVEQPPVYGVWGECKKQSHDVARSCTSECHSYRTVTINEKNSCTGVIRVKRTYQESKDCACPSPVGTCHVSNKGGDGKNNNLQFDWKLNGEGHEKHTCPKYNPPDFMSTEKDCNIQHVQFCEGS